MQEEQQKRWEESAQILKNLRNENIVEEKNDDYEEFYCEICDK